METVVQCDASSIGVGAVLLQRRQPTTFAGRTLTMSERNYAQIEKELLAVVFAMTRFRQYMYGRKVTVDSDHKQLQAIAAKPLASAPKRLQRMFLVLLYRSSTMRSVTEKDVTCIWPMRCPGRPCH